MDYNKFIDIIDIIDHPKSLYQDLSFELKGFIQKSDISLYEWYLVKEELFNFLFDYYSENIFSTKPSLHDLIALINQKLLSYLFDVDNSNIIERINFITNYIKPRSHYIFEILPGLLKSSPEKEALEKYNTARRQSQNNDYYYPNQVSIFPLEYLYPESLILKESTVPEGFLNKDVSEGVGDILVALALKDFR